MWPHTHKQRISRYLWCKPILSFCQQIYEGLQFIQHHQTKKRIRDDQSIRVIPRKSQTMPCFIDFFQLATCELKDGSKVSSLYSARPLNFVTQPLLLKTIWTCLFRWSSQMNRKNKIIKGSSKVKLPTICRDEKQRCEESERREE